VEPLNGGGIYIAVFAACVPDLDFLVGLTIGDISLYHQGPSHSLTAALAFGVVAGLVWRWLGAEFLRVGVMSTALYGFRLLLDCFVEDKRAPLGLPLLWPLSEKHWMGTQPFLRGVKHGVPGDSTTVFLSGVFSWDNLGTLVIESILFLPLLLLSWHVTRKQWGASKGH
jgi:hypothetical protein